MRFKSNQQVVCIAHSLRYEQPNKWYQFWKSNKPIGPKYNEIVTVDKYNTPGYVFLKEYPQIQVNGCRGAFCEDMFEPLVSDEELYAALQSESIES